MNNFYPVAVNGPHLAPDARTYLAPLFLNRADHAGTLVLYPCHLGCAHRHAPCMNMAMLSRCEDCGLPTWHRWCSACAQNHSSREQTTADDALLMGVQLDQNHSSRDAHAAGGDVRRNKRTAGQSVEKSGATDAQRAPKQPKSASGHR